MRLIIVIPARIGSSRLREKPLRLLRGEPLIKHVVRAVLAWSLDVPLVVATDDARVVQMVEPLGVHTMLTGRTHLSGTHRVAEVIDRARFRWVDTVLNVQGDLPFLGAGIGAAALHQVSAGFPIGTVGVPLGLPALADENRVKVVVDTSSDRALRFARTVPASAAWPCEVAVLEHVGVYAYTRQSLRRWVRLPAVPQERFEGLEQLRPLAHGIPIGVAQWTGPAPMSIDTEHDLARAQGAMTLMGHGGM